LESLANSIREGKPLDTYDFLQDLDSNIRFFVLGLSPNAARASVRFFYNDPFGKAISNVLAHHQDMAIINEYGEQDRFYSIYQIVQETVSKKSKKQDPSPLLTGAVFRSVLMNLPYPAALYNAILIRVRADQDDKEKSIKKINHIRAAIIKAFLLRKYRNQNKYQEELQMSLNKDSTNQAYLLGRLFAVMEKAQQDAAEKELNATIKDRYFTSACATPATTFPILLRLSQHYISKAKYGSTNDRRIQDIMQMLDVEKTPFPKHLTLDEQGIFVLGYYHQRADFYKKKNNSEIDNEED
jgi:CRISPR-associated protein Csd1